jgi:hypothetical protein
LNLLNKEPGLRSDAEFYYWKKGESFVLSPYFHTTEFSCHCNYKDCIEQKISKSLITKLDLIRKDINQPLVVTSGNRCTKYQAHLRNTGVNTVVAKTLSQHELGKAADCYPANRNMTGFEDTCAKYFDSIGEAKTFLHLDLRPGKRRWLY